MSLCAGSDNPLAPVKGFMIGTIAASLIGAVYGYVIMPRLDGFAMLAAAYAPVLLLLGTMMASPRWMGIALPTLLGLGRSEEHTSELQSLMRISYGVFCLKKTNR